MDNLRNLNENELQNTNGGSVFMVAFGVAVVYGYVKEKFESGQWHL